MHLTKVGLTGGIATGKSSVAELWRQRNATVIDSDVLAHQTLEPGTPTHAQIVETFGKGILKADGTVNRAVLGEIVFADEQRRLALNQIVHPAVRQRWTQALAEANPSEAAVVVIPLLFEVAAEREFDCVVVVGCSEQTQLARLAAKGLTGAQAHARIRSQLPTQVKMDRGNFVIWNDGSPRVLAEQAEMIWAKIKEN